MTARIRLLLLTLFLVPATAVLLPPPGSDAQESSPAGASSAPGAFIPAHEAPLARQGLVLLRHGEVIEGLVSQAGDYYYLVLPDGQVRLRATDVRMVCDDLEDAYWLQRDELRPREAVGHLRLAHWCLKHELYGHAARELADAIDSQPSHPAIPLFRRRLEIQLQASRSRAEGESAVWEGRVFSEGYPDDAGDEAPAGASSGVSFNELDRLVAAMPPGAVESFVGSVQPLLLNNCTASGCHGPQSETPLRLMRLPANRMAGRRLTQRNLHAVMQWVDVDRPEASPLLRAAAEAHGPLDKPVFDQRSREQYERLVRWVRQAAGGRPGEAPVGGGVPVTPSPWGAGSPAAFGFLAGANAADETAADPELHLRASPPESRGELGGDEGPDRCRTSEAGPEPAQPEPRIRYGTQAFPFVPADPYDPAVFNRRYFPVGRADEGDQPPRDP
jgi:hypothetical protein